MGAFTVLGIREQLPDKKSRGIVSDAREGLKAVLDRPWVLAVMTATCVQIMIGTATALTLLPIVTSREFGGGFAYGATLAAVALGALPGVYLASKWRPARRGTVSMIALVCYGGLRSVSPPRCCSPLVILLFALGGFAVELYSVYWLSALQRAVPANCSAVCWRWTS
nr:hypothetical protein [Kibdelosporangium phytohabitans]